MIALPSVTAPSTVSDPVTPVFPPTFRFSATPTPPSTINAPVVALVEVVVSFKLVAPVTSSVPSRDVLFVTSKSESRNKLLNCASPFVPLTALLVIVAFGTYVNLLSLLSQPKKPLSVVDPDKLTVPVPTKALLSVPALIPKSVRTVPALFAIVNSFLL